MEQDTRRVLRSPPSRKETARGSGDVVCRGFEDDVQQRWRIGSVTASPSSPDMNRLVITKLEHLRFAISVGRSNMSACSLVQSHGISCCRVSGGASTSTTASPSIRASVCRPPQQQSCNLSRPRYPAARNNAYANGNRVASKENARSSLECWTLWQTMNYSVADIVRRGLTEIQVYEQICECVQQGKEIDWFDLCQEAGFSPQTVSEINDAKERAKEAQNEPLEQRLDEFGLVPVQCGHHVTDIHILLYNTMMTCGITPHEMFLTPPEERPSQVPEKTAPPKKTISKEAKKAAAPNGKLTSSPAPEEPDSTKTTTTTTTPKRLTQKHMLQWMNDRNGVTLMELVLEFQGYNECQLMRLILLLERKKLIQLSQGIFRVTAPDDQASM